MCVIICAYAMRALTRRNGMEWKATETVVAVRRRKKRIPLLSLLLL